MEPDRGAKVPEQEGSVGYRVGPRWPRPGRGEDSLAVEGSVGHGTLGGGSEFAELGKVWLVCFVPETNPARHECTWKSKQFT